MTSTVTRIQLRNISTSTTDPHKSGELMLDAAKKSIKLTKIVMQNHFYSYGNKIRKQKKGGAIGNKLTERVGKVLMKRHAKKVFMSA